MKQLTIVMKPFRAEAVLKSSINADRAKVVAEYVAALELKGDVARAYAEHSSGPGALRSQPSSALAMAARATTMNARLT